MKNISIILYCFFIRRLTCI